MVFWPAISLYLVIAGCICLYWGGLCQFFGEKPETTRPGLALVTIGIVVYVAYALYRYYR